MTVLWSGDLDNPVLEQRLRRPIDLSLDPVSVSWRLSLRFSLNVQTHSLQLMQALHCLALAHKSGVTLEIQLHLQFCLRNRCKKVKQVPAKQLGHMY